MTAAWCAALLLFGLAPTAACAAWSEPSGAQPLNRDPDRQSFSASVTTIGGVPYVSWRERDATNFEVRVARLNAAGNAWEPVGEALSPASPINRSSIRSAFETSITSIGGVPYVAFVEEDASSVSHLRVSRLNNQGSGWEAVGEATDPANPINHVATASAVRIDIDGIGGVPYVAWRETLGSGPTKIRVSRLAPDGLSWTEVVGGDTPVNRSETLSGDYPSLASVSGVPHVSWAECDLGNCSGNHETRVARYDSGANDWIEIAGSASPINQSMAGGSNYTGLTSIDGVPYVAWAEFDGTASQLRVARLNEAGDAWEKVGQADDPASPINASATQSASGVRLAGIGGVPYVAWSELDGTAYQVRVARLNGAGSGWNEVVGGPSPINFSATKAATFPDLASVGGVPYIAWTEDCPNCGPEDTRTRAARLEPTFLAQSATVNGTGATLRTTVRTFGVLYAIAFRHGRGTGLGNRTVSTVVETSNTGSAVVTRPLTGLEPGLHSWRPIGFDGVRVAGAGPIRTFTIPDTVAPTLSASLTDSRFEVGELTRFRYTLSEPAQLVIIVHRKRPGRRVGGKCRKPTSGNKGRPKCTRHTRAGKLTRNGKRGSNEARFRGRIGGDPLDPGRYRATLRATDQAGNKSARRRLSFRIVAG